MARTLWMFSKGNTNNNDQGILVKAKANNNDQGILVKVKANNNDQGILVKAKATNKRLLLKIVKESIICLSTNQKWLIDHQDLII